MGARENESQGGLQGDHRAHPRGARGWPAVISLTWLCQRRVLPPAPPKRAPQSCPRRSRGRRPCSTSGRGKARRRTPGGSRFQAMSGSIRRARVAHAPRRFDIATVPGHRGASSRTTTDGGTGRVRNMLSVVAPCGSCWFFWDLPHERRRRPRRVNAYRAPPTGSWTAGLQHLAVVPSYVEAARRVEARGCRASVNAVQDAVRVRAWREIRCPRVDDLDDEDTTSWSSSPFPSLLRFFFHFLRLTTLVPVILRSPAGVLIFLPMSAWLLSRTHGVPSRSALAPSSERVLFQMPLPPPPTPPPPPTRRDPTSPVPVLAAPSLQRQPGAGRDVPTPPWVWIGGELVGGESPLLLRALLAGVGTATDGIGPRTTRPRTAPHYAGVHGLRSLVLLLSLLRITLCSISAATPAEPRGVASSLATRG